MTPFVYFRESDFTYLVQYLKRKGKKIIVIASGQVFHTLKDLADLYINAQTVKVDIASIKKTAPLTAVFNRIRLRRTRQSMTTK